MSGSGVRAIAAGAGRILLRILHFAAAWLAACLAATVMLFVLATFGDLVANPAKRSTDAVVIALKGAGFFIVAAGALIVLFTSWMWPILMGLIRLTGLPRPWVDIAFGMLAFAGVALRFYSGEVVLLGFYVVIGALAGWMYWLAMGRPRPPYGESDSAL